MSTPPRTLPTTTTELPTTALDRCSRGICEPPDILVQMENVTRSAGQTITSLCLTGETGVTYRWYKNGDSLSHIDGKIEISMLDSSTLSLLDAQPSDNGWYTCEAANEYGSSFTRGYIHVIGPPPRCHVLAYFILYSNLLFKLLVPTPTPPTYIYLQSTSFSYMYFVTT